MDQHQIGSYHGRILIFLQQRKVCCNLGNQLVMNESIVLVYNLMAVLLSFTLNLHQAKMYYLALLNLPQLRVSSFRSPDVHKIIVRFMQRRKKRNMVALSCK